LFHIWTHMDIVPWASFPPSCASTLIPTLPPLWPRLCSPLFLFQKVAFFSPSGLFIHPSLFVRDSDRSLIPFSMCSGHPAGFFSTRQWRLYSELPPEAHGRGLSSFPCRSHGNIPVAAPSGQRQLANRHVPSTATHCYRSVFVGTGEFSLQEKSSTGTFFKSCSNWSLRVDRC